MGKLMGLSIAGMVTGVVVLGVLLGVGLYAKKTVHDTIMTRLEYELPDGAGDSEFQQCYHSTSGNFANEYYLWNLTNLPQVLLGAKPAYNLTGPYVYTQWYCNYNFTLDYSTGFLRYKQLLQGYRFVREQSVTDDSVLVTNVNPGYMGVIQAAGDETSLLQAMSGNAVQKIIQGFQDPTTVQVIRLNSVYKVLSDMNSKILFLMAVTAQVGSAIAGLGTSSAVFFGINYSFTVSAVNVQGWYNYTVSATPDADTNINATSLASIFQVWQNGTRLAEFATLTSAQVAAQYYVTSAQATTLLAYLNSYLLLPVTFPALTIPAQVLSNFYSQWANGSLGLTLQSGWEIGYPTPSGISGQDVALLFNTSSDCSLTSAVGIQKWMQQLQNTTGVPTCTGGVAYTLTSPQFAAVLNWYAQYATTVTGPILLQQAGVTNWNDFAYAQWGGLVLGQTLGNTPTTPFAPELAAFDIRTISGYGFLPETLSKTCVYYSDWTQAKSLLVGPYGLTNSSNLIPFLQAVVAGDTSKIYDNYPEFGGDIWKPRCLAAYLAYFIAFRAVQPDLYTKFISQGKGMFVTRSVNEWFFNAKDEFLQYIGQNNDTALVGNTTLTRAQADQKNFTYYRVYTGDNDLHWSLMPYNEGVQLPFWNGNFTITGYNGTQFMPYNAIEDENPGGHPLVLFHRLINRTIPFINQGKDKWDGVNVAYLTMDPSAVASAAVNPVNELYYSVYSGLINKTSNPPYLPVYLSRADQIGCEAAVTQNQTLTDSIFPGYDPEDKFSRHRLALFLLVEPLLGSTIWGNLPIQMNLKVTQSKTSLFYPNVTSHFAPIYWNAIGDIAGKKDLDTIKNVLYAGIIAWKALVGVGVGFGVICAVAGGIGFHHHKKHKNELKESSENSMANLKTSSSNSVSAFTN